MNQSILKLIAFSTALLLIMTLASCGRQAEPIQNESQQEKIDIYDPDYGKNNTEDPTEPEEPDESLVSEDNSDDVEPIGESTTVTDPVTTDPTAATAKKPKEDAAPIEGFEPIPAGAATGCFVSDTGTRMNMKVIWYRFTDASGKEQLRMDVGLDTRSLYVGARSNGVVITLGDKTIRRSTAKIAYEGAATVLPLASVTVDAPAPGTETRVVFDFRGEYGGIQMPTITAAGTIE